MLLRPAENELDTRLDVEEVEHMEPACLVELRPGDGGVRECARLETGAKDLGKAARTAQLGDQLQRRRELAGGRFDARGRPWIGDHIDVGEVGAALAGMDR